MPRGTQRNYVKAPRSTREKERALATPDSEVSRSQELRSPSEKLSTVPKCGARLSKKTSTDQVPDAQDDPFCKLPAGHGTSHPGFGYCKFHGGNTPAGKKAGARAMGRAIIQERMRTFGDKDDPALATVTPEQALLEEVRRSVALVRWLEEKISAWEFVDLESLTDADQAAVANIKGLGLPALTAETFKGTPYATDVHSWLTLYREERDHMIRVSKLTIDAGIQERQVRLAEQQGLLLSSVIRSILAALNLSPEQHELVPQVVPQIIRNATIQGELAS